MFFTSLVLAVIAAEYEESFVTAGIPKAVFLPGLYLPIFYILFREFKSIRPAVEAYNKEHNL